MTTNLVLPGQRLTADRLNSGLLIGRLVFFAARDAVQAITTGGVSGSSENGLSWDNIIVDELGAWSAAQPTRFTPPIAGWYKLTGGVGFAASSGGTRRGVTWLVNGSVAVASSARPHVSTTIANDTLTADARDLPVQLDGNDYVQLAPFHNAEGNLDTATGSYRPYIAAYYAGPA